MNPFAQLMGLVPARLPLGESTCAVVDGKRVPEAAAAAPNERAPIESAADRRARKRAQKRAYDYRNRELVRARHREYYLRNRERILEAKRLKNAAAKAAAAAGATP